jgi:hypothetical protein
MASETRRARFTEQLIIMVEPEVKDDIRAEAERRGVSISTVAREWLVRGRGIATPPAHLVVEGAHVDITINDDPPAKSPPPRAIGGGTSALRAGLGAVITRGA